MRIRMIGILATASLAVTSCGSAGGSAATKPRPPSPVNLTVYVNDSKVSVSPSAVGAGPVNFIVTNQARHAETLAILRSGASQPIATTAPINPMGTAQVSVDFKPGDYTIGTTAHGTTDASLNQPSSIRSASIHIGKARKSSGSDLLQP
jgi:hypothetical protein